LPINHRARIEGSQVVARWSRSDEGERLEAGLVWQEEVDPGGGRGPRFT